MILLEPVFYKKFTVSIQLVHFLKMIGLQNQLPIAFGTDKVSLFPKKNTRISNLKTLFLNKI